MTRRRGLRHRTSPAAAMTNQTALTFTASNGRNGNYHRYAANLSPSRPLGLCVQLHGDGYQEYTDLNSSYSVGGTEGIHRQALYRDMMCIVARTPDEAGETWWEDGAANAVYLRELIASLRASYPNLDRNRIWLVGYSGGSEQIARYFMPSSSSHVWGGGALCFGGGGLPDTTEQAYSVSLRANFPWKWWCGTEDDGTSEEDSPGLYDALGDAQEASAYYRNTRGFTTYLETPAGLNHFGADDRYGAIWGQFLHQVERPSSVSTTAVTRTSTGMTWTGTVANAPAVTLRASTSAFGSQAGTWSVGAVDLAARTVSITLTGFNSSTPLNWRVELGGNAAHGPLLASGLVSP